MGLRGPASFLNGPYCKSRHTSSHSGISWLCRMSLLRPQQQLLNILLVTVPVHAVCTWMSSFLLWHPFPLKEPLVMVRYSLFRNKVSSRVPVKLENIILSGNRSLKVCADLVKGNNPRMALLSWKPPLYPQLPCTSPQGRNFKKKMWA